MENLGLKFDFPADSDIIQSMNRIEGAIVFFAGLTPKREEAQREKYVRLYQEKGCKELEEQRLRETGREMIFGPTAGFVGILGMSFFIRAFERGDLVGTITGLAMMATASILARSMFRAGDNGRILDEQPIY